MRGVAFVAGHVSSRQRRRLGGRSPESVVEVGAVGVVFCVGRIGYVVGGGIVWSAAARFECSVDHDFFTGRFNVAGITPHACSGTVHLQTVCGLDNTVSVVEFGVSRITLVAHVSAS